MAVGVGVLRSLTEVGENAAAYFGNFFFQIL